MDNKWINEVEKKDRFSRNVGWLTYAVSQFIVPIYVTIRCFSIVYRPLCIHSSSNSDGDINGKQYNFPANSMKLLIASDDNYKLRISFVVPSKYLAICPPRCPLHFASIMSSFLLSQFSPVSQLIIWSRDAADVHCSREWFTPKFVARVNWTFK